MFGNYFAEKNLMSGSGSSSYSYERLESDIAKNKVRSVEVVQNAQVPTGSAIVKLSDGEKKVVHVTDVNKVIELAQQYKVTCHVDDVKSSDAGWLSMILPWIVIGVILMFMFAMMSRASGGGGGGNKMMNFGKSRAKMSRTNSVNFSNVAGLEEEKEELEEIVDFLKNPKKYTDVLGTSVKGRLNTLVHNVIINSVDRPVIQMSEEVHEAMQGLRVFMFENVYRNPVAKKEEGKAIHMITNLYEFYIKNPEFLPEQSQNMLKKGEELSRVVCDYIAGMTDTYAVKKFTEFFIPESCNRRKKSL